MSRNPCASCPLGQADKNNPSCRNCRKRVAYVTCLGRELNFAFGRMPEIEAPESRCPFGPRQAASFSAVSD